MPVALEQQAALPGGAGGIKAGNWRVAFAQHAVLVVDRDAAFVMHEHRARRAERDIGAGAEWRPVAGVLVISGARCAPTRPPASPSFPASADSVGASA